MAALDPIGILEAHVAAFNDRDIDGLLRGFTADAEWVTGRYRCSGIGELTELFIGAFGAIAPRLEIVRAVPGDGLVAAELVERMAIDGQVVAAPIAGFYTLRGGRIAIAKIYREGSADIPTAGAGAE
ncbi:nuclear transport factor 2 family protein [Flexivirga caeni]|uniref:Nuclear transport factor 2 family protein n=1 Tax=Flexivirga caeni TaxID=2294115 RepID=A0A3M9M833_9MICO|nr:nuclear transport factor 2 family protein [Flexivirga caeni]RNI21357.1 nuclear transport factor 2 family protein [Flexivirga caeni]